MANEANIYLSRCKKTKETSNPLAADFKIEAKNFLTIQEKI